MTFPNMVGRHQLLSTVFVSRQEQLEVGPHADFVRLVVTTLELLLACQTTFPTATVVELIEHLAASDDPILECSRLLELDNQHRLVNMFDVAYMLQDTIDQRILINAVFDMECWRQMPLPATLVLRHVCKHVTDIPDDHYVELETVTLSVVNELNSTDPAEMARVAEALDRTFMLCVIMSEVTVANSLPSSVLLAAFQRAIHVSDLWHQAAPVVANFFMRLADELPRDSLSRYCDVIVRGAALCCRGDTLMHRWAIGFIVKILIYYVDYDVRTWVALVADPRYTYDTTVIGATILSHCIEWYAGSEQQHRRRDEPLTWLSSIRLFSLLFEPVLCSVSRKEDMYCGLLQLSNKHSGGWPSLAMQLSDCEVEVHRLILRLFDYNQRYPHYLKHRYAFRRCYLLAKDKVSSHDPLPSGQGTLVNLSDYRSGPGR